MLKVPVAADLNQLDRWGRGALHRASEEGHTGVVRLLAGAGAQINCPTGGTEGLTALHLAASAGHADTVAALLEAGARPGASSGGGRTTPLHLAAAAGHWRVLQLLLTAGCLPDALDVADRTPLLLAVSHKRMRCADLLLRAGARTNQEDVRGDTAIREAVRTGCAGLVRSLLAAGAVPTRSHYLLHHAAQRDRGDVLTALLTSPHAACQINARDSHGNTPLMLAARSSYYRTVRLLLENGALPDLPNTVTGTTALYQVVSTPPVDLERTLELLVARGADPDLECNWETPLHRALISGLKRATACLVRLGADVRSRPDYLSTAVARGDLSDARLLLFAGCPPFPSAPGSDVMRWLATTKAYPMPLTHLCRIRIRQQLCKKVYMHIHALGLPKQLVHFLNFDDID